MSWSTAAVIAGAALLSGATALLSAVFAILLRYRFSKTEEAAADLHEFSIHRYDPLMRLTSEKDFEFLARQPGYRPEIGARFRANRRRIVRMYLRDLARNFRSMHAAARQLAAALPESDADLIGFLIRCQFTFWRRMLLIEMRLLLSAAKLPKLDLRALLEPLESLRLRVSA